MSIVSRRLELMWETNNCGTRLPMLIIFVTKVGQENGEFMKYNNAIIMHTFVGKTYIVSQLGKKMIVRNSLRKKQVDPRLCGRIRLV